MNDVISWHLQQLRGSLKDNRDRNSHYLKSFFEREEKSETPRNSSKNRTNKQTAFTLKSLSAGMRRVVPLAFADFVFGIAFGVLARQSGLSLAEATLMSGTVSAGTAQFVALEYWSTPLPVLTIILTTLVVNLRHLLMGVSISPWFARLNPFQTYGTAFFMSDETWALTMREFDKNRSDAAFMLGAGLLLLMTWVGGTMTGHALGAVIDDPAKWGLDFMFVALFVTLLVGSWKGKTNLLPWLVAGAVAVGAAQTLPGKWYILAGGIAGTIVGGIRDAR